MSIHKGIFLKILQGSVLYMVFIKCFITNSRHEITEKMHQVFRRHQAWREDD